MTSIRPDDLAAKMVSAALDAVPGLDPAEVEDLHGTTYEKVAALKPVLREGGTVTAGNS